MADIHSSATLNLLASSGSETDEAEASASASSDIGSIDEQWQHYCTHVSGALRSADSADEGLRAALRSAVHADDV
jgi:hypothetical protein